jgi:NAD-dependent dihydropyrimidine dehydrogenase PreA subunit
MSKGSTSMWHGIPRREIPWFPTVDADACIGCTLCYVTCGRGVFDMQDKIAIAARPYECMVGCSTCATVCPVEAITFPGRDVIWKLEREHKIFKIVRQESKEKRAKQQALEARAAAEDAVAKLTTRARLEVAGEFGEKRFLVKLEELVKGRPYDIVNIQLHVPTVQGAMEKAPSFMLFEVTSTEQEDIQGFLPELRSLIRDNSLVLVNETNVS